MKKKASFIFALILIFSSCSQWTEKYIKLNPIDINSSKPSIINIYFQAVSDKNQPIFDLNIDDILIYEDGILLKNKYIYKKFQKNKPFISKVIIAIDIGDELTREEKKSISLGIKSLIKDKKLLVDSKNQVMILLFSEDIDYFQNFSSNINEIFNSLDIFVDFKSKKYSNLNRIIFKLDYLLKDLSHKNAKSLILLTKHKEPINKSILKSFLKLSESNNKIFAIGVGKDIKINSLSLFGSSGGMYKLNNYKNIRNALNNIFFKITNVSKSFYILEYLSSQKNIAGEENNHVFILQIKENANSDKKSVIKAKFNSSEFIENKPYISLQNLKKSNNRFNFTAKSFWVQNKPEYIWSLLDNSLADLTINNSDNSQATLSFSKDSIGKTTLLVKDLKNGLKTSYPIHIGVYENILFNFEDNVVPVDFEITGVGWKISKEKEINSIKSKNMNDNDFTSLILKGYFEGDYISFKYKISSEEGCDEMIFLIDGKGFYQSGLIGWKTFKYKINSGEHKFEWKFVKDKTMSKYKDAVWIDDIKIGKFKLSI